MIAPPQIDSPQTASVVLVQPATGGNAELFGQEHVRMRTVSSEAITHWYSRPYKMASVPTLLEESLRVPFRRGPKVSIVVKEVRRFRISPSRLDD